MANVHLYIVVEDVALTAEQRSAIIDAFQALGPASNPQPAHLMHGRKSLDGSKVNFEALFDDETLTVDHVRNFLAAAVEVDSGLISDSLQQSVYGPVVTYSAGGTDRIRFLVCGGRTAAWNESRLAFCAYMKAFQAEWEPVE